LSFAASVSTRNDCMQRDVEAYLWDISSAIDQIEEFCGVLDFPGYLHRTGWCRLPLSESSK
jgi:hypothetical protein